MCVTCYISTVIKHDLVLIARVWMEIFLSHCTGRRGHDLNEWVSFQPIQILKKQWRIVKCQCNKYGDVMKAFVTVSLNSFHFTTH